MDWQTMTPERYEIYFADLNPAANKVRPVVIVSQNAMNRYLDTVVVCPLTSSLHPQWRSRIQTTCAGKNAEIAIDQIRTISKQRLREKIDRLSNDAATRVRRLITEMYGEA